MLSEYKKYIKFFIAIFFLTFAFKSAYGATLTLTKIGALDLGGKIYSEWWYTGVNPTFYGTAAAGSSVNIKIAETPFTVTADASGKWSYPATIEKGDYAIVLSSGPETLAFTLHLGQTMPTSSSAPAIPTTGFNQFVGITFGVGIILLATYLYFSSDGKRKHIFENRMLKED
jgi:hypothetical protein